MVPPVIEILFAFVIAPSLLQSPPPATQQAECLRMSPAFRIAQDDAAFKEARRIGKSAHELICARREAAV